MPRIDPGKLLDTLSVLLTNDGGIVSNGEVPRLVNLMTKFSKKLVSKCVYVLILKNTETDLVDMFMAEGGWALIQTWLQDAVQTSNWDLVREILGLLLITPVDVERLKMNILPKLIKSLSRKEELEGVAQLSTQLVQQWLSIVKGSTVAAQQVQQDQISAEQQVIQMAEEPIAPASGIEAVQPEETAKNNEMDIEKPVEAIAPSSFYKSADKDGKLVIRKMSLDDDDSNKGPIDTEIKENKDGKNKTKEDNNKSSSRSSKSSSSSSSRSGSSKEKDRKDSKDKDRDYKKSSSSKHSSSTSSRSKSSSGRDKDRKDKDRDKDKDRHRTSSSKSSTTSSSSKDKKDSSRDKEKDKTKQAEKDKDTLNKIKPATIDKMGRIPKKTSSTSSSTTDDKSTEIKKKPFSVGIKKDSEDRPKTVKIFNSKMRSTGLEEEIKPAPPRPVKKPSQVQLPPIPPVKRPSPVKDIRSEPFVPPEKKIKMDKIEGPERPGAIKLIKPKPMLQESDLFMDALTAATTKKEPKKRKRRPSVSKDNTSTTTSSPTSSPARETPQTPTSPTGGSQLGLKNIAPINFYQDTLTEESENQDDENKENNASENDEDASNNNEEDKDKESPSSSAVDTPSTPTDDDAAESKKPRMEGELKGVLLYSKKKGPKKCISWKGDSTLVEIRYFELDETERVNVTKTFGDMARMEMTSEREAMMSRKIVGEDLMEPQTNWRVPYELDVEDPPAVPGCKSLEKDVQFAREKSVLQAFYFDKRKIPDSPEEPIPENHQMCDPIVIPLDDPEGQDIDLRGTPWPEPKGQAPQPEPIPPPQIFQNMPGPPFNPPFNNMGPPQFQGMPQNMPPRFNGPSGPPGGFVPPNMMPNGNMMPNANIMGPPNMPPNDLINMNHNMNHNMNPNMFPPGGIQDGFGPGPGPAPDFSMFGNPNMPPNMQNPNLPPKNMFPPKNFNQMRGNHIRGGFRRGGNNSPNNGGNWVRMSGNWKRGGRGGRLCKNVQNHGYCRNIDTCPFIHT